MKIPKNAISLILDCVLFFLLILMYKKDSISLAFHQIGGLILCVLFLIHILLNVRWIKKVSLKLFSSEMPLKTRFGWFLNVSLLLCFMAILLSGMFLSRTLLFPGLLPREEQLFWKKMHFSVSAYGLICVGIHVGLHWNHIKNMFKKWIHLPGKLTKPLSIVVLVFCLAAGIFNLRASSFFRWVGIPFEQETVQQFSNQQNISGKQDEIQLKKKRQQEKEPFSMIKLLELLYVYGSIVLFFAVLTVCIEKISIYKTAHNKKTINPQLET